jgi:hypothetical protein
MPTTSGHSQHLRIQGDTIVAKKALKKSKRLAGRMMLATAAGNLQMFKEYMVQIGFFDGKNNKDIWEMLGKAQGNLREIRKHIGKKIKPATTGDQVGQQYDEGRTPDTNATESHGGGKKKAGARN